MAMVFTKRFSRERIVAHVLFWVVTLSLASTTSTIQLYHLNRWHFFLESAAGLLVLLYGLHLSYLYLVQKKDLKQLYFFLVAPLFFVQNIFGGVLMYGGRSNPDLLFLILKMSAGVLFIGTLYFLMEYGIAYLEIKKNQTEMEKKLLRAELTALRSMINPHFLLNSLNNIYSLCYFKDDRAAPSVARLGDLMRYILEESPKESTELSREIQFADKYIELQKIKFEERRISFLHSGIREGITFPPLLLVHLVENCFKHSDISFNPEGYIAITCSVESGRVQLTTENSVPLTVKTTQAREGIGVKTVQNLLEHSYPNRHTFSSHQKENVFYTRVEVELCQ